MWWIEDDLEKEHATLSNLKSLGIDLDAVTEQLELEGIEKFSQPFYKLMDEISRKARMLHPV